MKELEKLALECVEKRRNEIFAEESQPTDLEWFIPVYEAGFRKAREMSLQTCERQVAVTGWWYKLLKEIQDIGEREVV